MPYVDLAFRLTGSKVPVDHGYALYSAISRLLPEIHGAKNIGVHPIRGTRKQTVPDTFFLATVRFSKRIAPYIRETCWHSSQKITPQSDGGILFQVEVSEPKEVGWWVLQWGAEAEVLEPKSLRRELQETAERLLTLYGKMNYGGDKTQG
jgi:hypothetical protein